MPAWDERNQAARFDLASTLSDIFYLLFVYFRINYLFIIALWRNMLKKNIDSGFLVVEKHTEKGVAYLARCVFFFFENSINLECFS